MLNKKTYYIKTYGCQANIADSNFMGRILETLGWEKYISLRQLSDIGVSGENGELEEVTANVDLLIINSCSVRQKSEDKVYGIGKIVEKLTKNGVRRPKIILAGCMVGSAKGDRKRYELEELKKRMPWVDEFISPSEILLLPKLLDSSGDDVGLVSFTDKAIRNNCDNEDNSGRSLNKTNSNLNNTKKEYAYINISTGCDNFCRYCVVPYSRGKEISRSREEIFKDIYFAIDEGYTKIMLCGQNVNSWGLALEDKIRIRAGESYPTPFVDLIRKVVKIPKLQELGFISSNPFDFTKELVETLKLPKMSKYLHIAVQSGNDEILRKMNRRHSVKEFVSLIESIRNAVPNIELGTDIIVGFPGETKEQFMDTVRLISEMKFKTVYISMYSERKGTLAANLYKDDVPLKEKKWRHAYLTKVWKDTLKN